MTTKIIPIERYRQITELKKLEQITGLQWDRMPSSLVHGRNDSLDDDLDYLSSHPKPSSSRG